MSAPSTSRSSTSRVLSHCLPRARFIMKKQLRWAPILGLYALRIGSTPSIAAGARRR